VLHTKDQEMNNLSAPGIMMSTQLAIEIGGTTIWDRFMIPALSSASIFVFFAGLLVGYVLRVWQLQRRVAASLRYASRKSAPTTTTFGHARRAF
jgi:hypothetical protein